MLRPMGAPKRVWLLLGVAFFLSKEQRQRDTATITTTTTIAMPRVLPSSSLGAGVLTMVGAGVVDV